MSFGKPYFGVHVSIKNGIISAIDYVKNIGGNMIQIFISNPISIKASIDKNKFNEKNVNLIKNKLYTSDAKIVIHLPYVINLAKTIQPDVDKCWWLKMITDHLTISESIDSIGCIVHVGKFLDLTESDGIDNMYNGLVHVINFMKEHNMKTHIILETGSGQGTELLITNGSLENFANFYNKFTEEQKKYIKICVDTCHIFAAGYDIKKKSQVKHFFDEFNSLIGIEQIFVIHLNDSKSNCGSRLDRHENIGDGKIGMEGLRHFIRYGIYYKIPMILETPIIKDSEITLINDVKNGVNKWISKKNIN